jgi:hypothetical protein
VALASKRQRLTIVRLCGTDCSLSLFDRFVAASFFTERTPSVAETDFWSQEFPITNVTREDLVSAGFPEHIVEKINDDDMRQIASAMEDMYLDSDFWEDLARYTKRTLERKEEDAALEQDEQMKGEED